MLKRLRGSSKPATRPTPEADVGVKPTSNTYSVAKTLNGGDVSAHGEEAVEEGTVSDTPKAVDPVRTPSTGDPATPLSRQQQSSSEPFPSTEAAPSPTPDILPSTSTSAVPAPATAIQQPAGIVQRIRRLSFRSFGFFYGRSTVDVATATEVDEDAGKSGEQSVGDGAHSPLASNIPAATTNAPLPIAPASALIPDKLKKERRVTKADKRVISYALLLQSIIIGTPPSHNSNNSTKTPPIKKLKSELLKPKEANRLIAEVRKLPTPDTSKGVLHGTLRGLNGKFVEQDISIVPSGRTPIHAVCLDCTDDEADERHFSLLTSSIKPPTTVLSLTPEIAQAEPQHAHANPVSASPPTNIAQADMASLIPVLRNLNLIDLVSQSFEIVTDTVGSPVDDFGFGQAPGAGVLSGSVPSSSAVAQGFMQVGQEFLNLGYATSAAVVPNHSGIYPPQDRLSVLTYWWGYEVVIPPPSMKYLAKCKSISNALLNFLTAFSLVNNGVREILPFIRYAAQFIDFEWNSIKAQDKGKGVVCAATWIMPAALVPRSWDFEEPPHGAVARLTAFLKSRSATAPLTIPSPLPGTSVILPPVPSTPGTPSAPMVTLSPPMAVDESVSTEDEV